MNILRKLGGNCKKAHQRTVFLASFPHRTCIFRTSNKTTLTCYLQRKWWKNRKMGKENTNCLGLKLNSWKAIGNIVKLTFSFMSEYSKCVVIRPIPFKDYSCSLFLLILALCFFAIWCSYLIKLPRAANDLNLYFQRSGLLGSSLSHQSTYKASLPMCHGTF